MARSFFERLTGSVKVSEVGREPPRERKSFSTPPRVPRSADREETKERTAPEPVLHPVAAEDRREPEGESEPEEEEGQLTVDIFDDGSNIVVQSTVAGVKPEDIDISLQEETLTIRGFRQRAEEVNDTNFYYRELYWGSFARSIILPEEVDFTKADAAIKNGLLTVRLPKKDKGEKKLKVKVG